MEQCLPTLLSPVGTSPLPSSRDHMFHQCVALGIPVPLHILQLPATTQQPPKLLETSALSSHWPFLRVECGDLSGALGHAQTAPLAPPLIVPPTSRGGSLSDPPLLSCCHQYPNRSLWIFHPFKTAFSLQSSSPPGGYLHLFLDVNHHLFSGDCNCLYKPLPVSQNLALHFKLSAA